MAHKRTEMREAMRAAAERLGAQAAFETTRGNHQRATIRKGARKWRVVFASTPGDHRAARNAIGLIRRLIRADDRGVVMLEFAAALPVILLLILGSLDLYQSASQRATTNYIAEACSAIGGRALGQKQGVVAAVQAAKKSADDNQPLWLFGATATVDATAFDASGGETSDDNTAVGVACTVTATAPALFPFYFTPVIQTTITVKG